MYKRQLIEKAAVNEVRAYQAKLVLAYTGKNCIICRSIILDEQLLSELLFVDVYKRQGIFVLKSILVSLDTSITCNYLQNKV